MNEEMIQSISEEKDRQDTEQAENEKNGRFVWRFVVGAFMLGFYFLLLGELWKQNR